MIKVEILNKFNLRLKGKIKKKNQFNQKTK